MPIENESSSTAELWYYVHDQALLMGYEQRSKRLVGSLGPRRLHFPPPAASGTISRPTLLLPYGNRGNDSPDYLAFPGDVYTVEFFPAHDPDVILSLGRRNDLDGPPLRGSAAEAVTGIRFSPISRFTLSMKQGSGVFSAPLIYDWGQYTELRAGQLEGRAGICGLVRQRFLVGSPAKRRYNAQLSSCSTMLAAARSLARCFRHFRSPSPRLPRR